MGKEEEGRSFVEVCAGFTDRAEEWVPASRSEEMGHKRYSINAWGALLEPAAKAARGFSGHGVRLFVLDACRIEQSRTSGAAPHKTLNSRGPRLLQ